MKTLQYTELTHPDLQALDRDRTVLFSAVSPIEVHGPHLPLGTDVFIAESVRDGILARFGERRPDWTALVLPTLCLGANAIPVAGSVEIGHRTVMRAVLETGRAMAGLGFRTWVLADNHGGPLHEVGIELASRKLARQRLHLVAPFNALFRRMVSANPDLVARTGLGPGRHGGLDDSHAGTNETSLMLALHPERVREGWRGVGRGRTSRMRPATRLIAAAGELLARAGLRTAAEDLRFVSSALAWVGDPRMESYQGDPSLASPEAGRAMYDYHVALGVELLEAAVSGTPRREAPMGWSLRLLRFVM